MPIYEFVFMLLINSSYNNYNHYKLVWSLYCLQMYCDQTLILQRDGSQGYI